uniref:Fgenesh protein 128 n=1 Tax=Beta vulgaris TaxID=161934 RepID=Q20CB9_BETVU|nr:Fgenesh protein 128 [Beta vulgaris]
MFAAYHVTVVDSSVISPRTPFHHWASAAAPPSVVDRPSQAIVAPFSGSPYSDSLAAVSAAATTTAAATTGVVGLSTPLWSYQPPQPSLGASSSVFAASPSLLCPMSRLSLDYPLGFGPHTSGGNGHPLSFSVPYAPPSLPSTTSFAHQDITIKLPSP